MFSFIVLQLIKHCILLGGVQCLSIYLCVCVHAYVHVCVHVCIYVNICLNVCEQQKKHRYFSVNFCCDVKTCLKA